MLNLEPYNWHVNFDIASEQQFKNIQMYYCQNAVDFENKNVHKLYKLKCAKTL